MRGNSSQQLCLASKITETLKGSQYYKQTTNNTINAIIEYTLCKYVYEKRTDSCIFCVNMYKEN